MILLDTHVLVWYLTDDKRVGRRAMSSIDKALERRQLQVSSISFWEIGMLVEKGRLILQTKASAFRAFALGGGIVEDGLNGEIGIVAAELPPSHGDPADRFIVATAIIRGFTLLTVDDVLLGWKLRGLKTQDASA